MKKIQRSISATWLRKIVSCLAALWLISFVTFLLTKYSSADPAENYLRISKIQITPQALENARDYLGLNKSWLEQYGDWFRKAILGDFGISYLWKVPVLPLVLDSFLSTLSLALVSFVLIIFVSVPVGILTGMKKDSLFDHIVQFLTYASVSIPNFWLGYVLILLFSVQLNWLPVSGKTEITSFVLPSLTLSIPFIGQYISLIRKAVVQQLDSVHVENATFRGVKKQFIIRYHIFPNILPVIATGFSLSFVYLLTGSLIIEEVFAWNGVGGLFVKSLQAVDVPVIQACMMLFGILFLINNIFIQKIAYWLDPRLRRDKI